MTKSSTVVIVVGAGPAGMATSACLNRLSIPNIVIEREDCSASLWRKSTYDRLHLHLPKHFCELPHRPFPPTAAKYVPKTQFIDYLDAYAAQFNISPAYNRSVKSAEYEEEEAKWVVTARNLSSGETEEYSGRFLVVASGETADQFVPEVDGLDTFLGRVMHSTRFRSGKEFKDKSVLVVGSGNSGMEIALDLSDHGAKTSIVVRSPVHILSRWMVDFALGLLKRHVTLGIVDSLMEMLSKIVYGDLNKYGIERPKEGAFLMKVKYGKYPIIDVGTCEKLKLGKIQVLPAITKIEGNEVRFENEKSHPFDTIIFVTGFKRSTNVWLKEKGDECLLGEDGYPKKNFPDHWKGKNGLFCVGLSKTGFHGINFDAKNVANAIESLMKMSQDSMSP